MKYGKGMIYSCQLCSVLQVDALMNGLVKLREENPGVKSLVVSQFTSLLTLLEIPLRFVHMDIKSSIFVV